MRARSSLPVYRRAGLRAWYIGDEAIVRPATFSLDGRPIRKVRQSVSRLEKSGYTATVLDVAEISAGPAGRDRGGLARVARPGSRARLLDGDGHALRVPGQRGRLRRGSVGPDRRLHPSRPLAGERRLLALDDAPPRRRAQRADGVPDRRDARLGEGARRAGGVAQLRDLRPHPEGRRRKPAAQAGAALRPDQARPLLPGRAPAQLQPQVLPGVAAPLLLLRALRRPAAARGRVRARRGLRRAASAVGEDPTDLTVA